MWWCVPWAVTVAAAAAAVVVLGVARERGRGLFPFLLHVAGHGAELSRSARSIRPRIDRNSCRPAVESKTWPALTAARDPRLRAARSAARARSAHWPLMSRTAAAGTSPVGNPRAASRAATAAPRARTSPDRRQTVRVVRVWCMTVVRHAVLQCVRVLLPARVVHGLEGKPGSV